MEQHSLLDGRGKGGGRHCSEGSKQIRAELGCLGLDARLHCMAGAEGQKGKCSTWTRNKKGLWHWSQAVRDGGWGEKSQVYQQRANEMVGWVKMAAPKPDDLSSVSMVEVENLLPRIIF